MKKYKKDIRKSFTHKNEKPTKPRPITKSLTIIEERRLCVDCKWFKSASPLFSALEGCTHPQFIDPVKGFAVDAYALRKGKCGQEGKYWKAKELNNLLNSLKNHLQ